MNSMGEVSPEWLPTWTGGQWLAFEIYTLCVERSRMATQQVIKVAVSISPSRDASRP